MDVPDERIFELYEQEGDLAAVQETLVIESQVYPKVVARRMADTLPYNFAYCIEKDGIVVACGGSASAHAVFQDERSTFNSDPYRFFKKRFLYTWEGENTHWWTFDIDIEKVDDQRTWRQILNVILYDVIPDEQISYFRQSVNGTFAGAFSSWKMRNKSKDLDEFMRDVVLRFNYSKYSAITKHLEFLSLVRKKCEELMARF
jgi:hypothetical protein